MASKNQPLPLSPREDRTLTIPRPIVFALLLALYAVCYLLIPYWNLPEKVWQRQAMAIITGAAGLWWAYLTSGAVRLRVSRQGLWWFLAALGVLAAANYLPITTDLSWRGDEDHHFKAAYMMGGVLAQSWFPLVLVLLPLVVLSIRRPAQSPAMRPILLAIGAVSIAAALLVSWQFPPKLDMNPATYPLLVPTMAALPVRLLGLLYTSQPYPAEWTFRVVPFLAAVTLAWYCSRQALAEGPKRPLAAAVLMTLALGTVPVLYYYSSILYLEMPAIVCMTIVCFGARTLLTVPVEELTGDPRWYALILLGFMKDTMIAYLAAFMLCRLGVRAIAIVRGSRRIRNAGILPARTAAVPAAERPTGEGKMPSLLAGETPALRIWAALLGEIRMGLCVLVPYVTYATYRVVITTVPRQYHPTFSNFLDGQTYDILAGAFTTEYGLLGVLFLAGLVMLWVQKKRLEMLLGAAAFGAWAVMHITDLADVLGYSRFMLYFLPVMIVPATLVIGAAWRKAPAATLAGLVIWTAVNLFMSPFHADGSKVAAWGQFRSDTQLVSMSWLQDHLPPQERFHYRFDWTEHTYPYRSAIGYVKQKYPGQNTAIMGLYYQFWQEYYAGNNPTFRRFPEWTCARIGMDESFNVQHRLWELTMMLMNPQARRNPPFQHVLYHVMGPRTPQPLNTYAFVEEKVFSNDAHQIVLYSLDPQRIPAVAPAEPGGGGR